MTPTEALIAVVKEDPSYKCVAHYMTPNEYWNKVNRQEYARFCALADQLLQAQPLTEAQPPIIDITTQP